MGGVRDKGANLVFGAFAHLQSRVHVIEQLIEGVAYGTDFGARVGISRIHSHRRGDGVFFQVQVRHIGCHRGDSFQGFHGAANNVGARHAGTNHDGNGAEGHHDHEDGEGLLYVGKRNTNHLGVGAAISLRGDFDEVQAGFQLDLSDFFFGGIQRHGSEGYLVIGGEGLYGTVLTELAGDFHSAFGLNTGNDGSGRLTGRKERAALLQVAAVHFFSLAVSGGRLHYAVTGFFEVALRLLVEGVLQGHVGGQANNEAGDAEGCHKDGDKARTQVGYVPEFFGGCLGIPHALPGGA